MMLSVYVCKPSIYIVLPYSYIKCLSDNLKPAQSLLFFRWKDTPFVCLLQIFCTYFDILYMASVAMMRTNGKMKNKFST